MSAINARFQDLELGPTHLDEDSHNDQQSTITSREQYDQRYEQYKIDYSNLEPQVENLEKALAPLKNRVYENLKKRLSVSEEDDAECNRLKTEADRCQQAFDDLVKTLPAYIKTTSESDNVGRLRSRTTFLTTTLNKMIKNVQNPHEYIAEEGSKKMQAACVLCIIVGLATMVITGGVLLQRYA